jgi:hypothetical protein
MNYVLIKVADYCIIFSREQFKYGTTLAAVRRQQRFSVERGEDQEIRNTQQINYGEVKWSPLATKYGCNYYNYSKWIKYTQQSPIIS